MCVCVCVCVCMSVCGVHGMFVYYSAFDLAPCMCFVLLRVYKYMHIR